MRSNRGRNPLQGQFLRPRLDERMIPRPRVMSRIASDSAASAIRLFIAPAGYGKTVLMSQYCGLAACPVVWYQLDAQEDPASFIDRLVEGLRPFFPSFGKETSLLLKKPGALNRPLTVITGFFQELSACSTEKVLLAFDDYHHLTEPAMHGFMELFLTHLPRQVECCLASRTPLPFSLSRLEIDGRVVTVDSETIRFSPQEIAFYFNIENPQDDRVERLEQQTEGWPVALRLIKNTAPQLEMWEPAKSPQLFDYLASEVLRNQPGNVKRFLQATSVLDVLIPKVCNTLLGIKNSAHILEDLNRQQLFVSPLSGGNAYRYHQLFREFLLNSLGYDDKAFFYKAGSVCQEIGRFEDAIRYFTIAGAVDEVIIQAIEHGQKALERGHWQKVAEWLSAIPLKRLMKEPWLILYHAEVEIIKGRLAEADHLLEKVESRFKKQNNIQGLSECLCQQARVMRSRGYYSKSLTLMDKALSYSYAQKFNKRIDFSIEKGFALALAGKFDESETELSEALAFAEAEGDSFLIASFSESLSNLYFLKGDYSKAMEMYRRAVNVSPEPVQTSYYMRDSVALIFRDWGELERALEHALRSIAVKEKLGLVEVLPYAYYQLASIQTDLGEKEQAEKNYRRSMEIAVESGGEQVFRIMSMSMLAKLLTGQNRFVEAVELAEKAMELSKSQSPYVIAFTNEMVAPVLMQTGRVAEAVQMLFDSTAVLEQVGAKYPLCIAYGVLTTILMMMGDSEKAEKYARQCLTLAARENYLQIFITTFDLFQPVLEIGLKKGTETLFIQKILVQLGTRALELLSRLVSSPDSEVRRRTIIPLTETGGEKAEQLMRSLAADPDAATSSLAGQMARRIRIDGAIKVGKPAPAPLKIELLGSLRIIINGVNQITEKWKTQKSRDLLTYLVHRGEAVSRDQILEDLWPDMSSKKSAQLFHTTMYNLRRFLNQSCRLGDAVIYSGGKYQLDEASYTTDREEYEQLLNKAKSGELSKETVLSTLAEASTLYRGDYLSGMDYAWIILYREHLEISYLRSLKQLSQLYLEREEINQAIFHLQQMLNKDPFDEEVCQLLMTAYAKAGNPVKIKRIYHSFFESLDNELGIAPSSTTSDLYQQLTRTGSKKR